MARPRKSEGHVGRTKRSDRRGPSDESVGDPTYRAIRKALREPDTTDVGRWLDESPYRHDPSLGRMTPAARSVLGTWLSVQVERLTRWISRRPD